MIHRGLNPKCVGLVPGKHPGDPKSIKVFQAGFYVSLLDMNRSEPFLSSANLKAEYESIPEGW